jgi:L-threonylcarbamoyladenylate synthase
MTIILNIKSASGGEAAGSIGRAAEIIRGGGLVVFPTETVYGIGANAFDSKACQRIFRVKRRAGDNPLIVHVSSMSMANLVGVIPRRYSRILAGIWPAPLTVIVKAKKLLPRVVTGGLDTVAIRMPDNKVALGLINESGVPIAAPSANISMKPSSTSADHARKYFDGSVDAIIDSGPSRFGIESTVINLADFSLLRPGSYTVEQIERAFGRKIKVTEEVRGLVKTSAKPLSPGTKYRHYSPDKPLYLFTGDVRELPAITRKAHGKFTFIGSNESCGIMKNYAESEMRLGSREKQRGVAHNLFNALINLDTQKSDFGIIENFNETGIGLAVMNRTRKACANKHFENRREFEKLIAR